MDVIVLGVYNISDKQNLDSVIAEVENLEIVWEYKIYNIEAERGIGTLEKSYSLYQTGILVNKERDATFSSYPLIYEVTKAFIEGSSYPKLFQFFDVLERSEIKKLIIAFADEWNENTLVKVEKLSSDSLMKRLNSIFVWCESYLNLISGAEMRGDDHPLVLEVNSVNSP